MRNISAITLAQVVSRSRKEYQHEYYLKNRERLNEKHKQYYKEHREEMKANQRRRYKEKMCGG